MQAASSHPKLAWEIIRSVSTAKKLTDLKEEHGLDTLRVKVRACLIGIIKGQFMKEIENLDEKMSKDDGQLNGLQIAYLMR